MKGIFDKKEYKETKITRKIYFFFGMLWVVFMLLFVFQFFWGREVAVDLTKQYNNEIFQEITEIIEQRFEQNGISILNIADLFSEIEFSDEEKLRIMQNAMDNNDYFSSIYYGEDNGHMLNGDGWVPYEGYDLTKRPWYIGAIENEGVYFSDPFINVCHNNMIISVSTRLESSENGAVISGDIPILTFIEHITEKRPSKNGFLFVVDDNNRVLSHLESVKFENDLISFEDSEFTGFINSVIGEQRQPILISFHGESGYAFRNNFSQTGLKLISFIPLKDIQIYTSKNLIISHSIMGISFILMYILFLFVRRLVVKPIDDVQKKLGNLEFKQDFSNRIEYSESNEFSSLVRSINSMLNRAQYAVEQRDSYKGELQALNDELIENNEILESKNKELKDEKEILDTLINNLAIVVTIWSKDGELIICNDGFKQLTGFEKDKFKSDKIWFNTLYPDVSYREMVMEKWEECSKNRIKLIDSFKITSKEGTIKEVEFRVSFLKDGGYVISMIDITDRKKMERALINSEKIAKEANQAKSEFLANMSHELRTPLNGIIGFSEVLNNTKLTVDQIEYIDYINSSGKKLLRIISDILDFSKIEAGKFELDIVETDLYKIAHNCINVISTAAEKKKIELLTDFDNNIPVVYADSLRLYQVIGNLMTNAVKFTKSGSIELSMKVEERIEEKITMKFCVQDTGIGINKENVKKIFESFTQADTSVTRKFGGTGLGLTISNSILRHMGSSIYVKSEEGQGSQFSFTVTFDVVKEQSDYFGEQETNVVAKDALTEGVKKSILVAEDDNINMKLVKLIIKKNFPGVSVISAEDGEMAYELYLSESPDLIITDLQMPGLNGFELTKKIRVREGDSQNELPIISFTADAAEKTISECYKCGMTDYITKPAKSETLIQKVRRYLQ